jgi:hypothetical protein
LSTCACGVRMSATCWWGRATFNEPNLGSHVETTWPLRPLMMSMLPAVAHVTRHASHVTRYTLQFTRHTSQFTRHTSHVTRYNSHVTRHTSDVSRHTLQFTRHTLQFTRHTSHVTRPALATNIQTPSGDAAIAVASACCELKQWATYTKQFVTLNPQQK